jgi:phosphomannomutase
MNQGLRERVEAWIAEDPDAETREELASLLSAGNEPELADRFAGALTFGTAGLRGVLGGGPNRMNRLVVRRTTRGLASYLLASVKDAATRGVVVGCDGRRLSRELAEETARVLLGSGIKVHLFDALAPTPLVAFAVLDQEAAGGVMITASHNPPEYNGYKVYWENGAQIIPPHDAGIAAEIARVGRLEGIESPPLDAGRMRGLVSSIGRAVEESYLAAVEALQLHRDVPRDLVIAYTPLHGVGDRLARSALLRSGFRSVHSVEVQREPDGRFPTVRFPNPEEKGAMDLVLALARQVGADLVLANDPDADRLAVAVPDGKGGYQALSGDQVGALLAYYLLTEADGGPDRLVVTTLVSSALLSQMARMLSVRYAETFTGFKWIANRALTLSSEGGARFVMGYEEALGYSIGTIVRDKDGVSAAMVFAELAAFCKSTGRTVLAYLEEIYRRFGLYRSAQHSLTLPGAEGVARIQEVMRGLRSSPLRSVGPANVVAFRDLERSVRIAGGREEALELPRSDVLVYELSDGGRITVRPSGTEPKLKCYFEVREPMDPAQGNFATATAHAGARLEALMADFLAAARIPTAS